MKAFLVFLFMVACAATHAQDSTAKAMQVAMDKVLRFTNADYDMGRISSGKPVEYMVTITNIGRDTLAVQHVAVGCGCTTPKYRAGEKLLPGKQVIVVLGFNGDAHGEFSRTADIVFSNGMVKQVRFHGTAAGDTPAANNF